MQRSEIQTNKDSLYNLLEISKKASTEEVRHAYKKAAKKTHPDAYVESTGKFEEINMAYSILANRKQRLLYNMFGDSILPILVDNRYAQYIESLLTNKALVLGLVALNSFILATVFYPYLVLLAGVEIIPFFALTMVPHFVVYFIAMGTVLKMCPVEVKYRASSYGAVAGLILLQALFSLLYIDKIMSRRAFYIGAIVIELGHVAAEFMRNCLHMEITTWSFIIKKTVRRLAGIFSLVLTLLRISLTGMLLLDRFVYVPVMLVSMYAAVLGLRSKHTPLLCGSMGIGVFVTGALIAYMGTGQLGVFGWLAVFVMLILSLSFSIFAIYKMSYMFETAKWDRIGTYIKDRIEARPQRPVCNSRRAA
ncbi:uncharacterized protein NESG_00275 [Nematocida ausubeli]|uniref:J domain-containing protein n=1 Tax=Nematocida ausubeli (strain ATCC PRA-371 / ERTm2) TaxID=1913371 RepID=A0A086J4Y0_NEMA1|nr:uncharacterized protein NESG_00275 [Nematocida ausubeli]KFG27198.1 hypothetical protein NESG_00275 [Nematocida ausubeli]